MMSKTKVNPTLRLSLSGIMLALSLILSLIPFFHLPYGGTVTPMSMLPVMLLGYLFGVRWGLFCGLVYGLLQAAIEPFTSAAFAGQTFGAVLLILFFDFIAAFSVLGFAGLFRKHALRRPLYFSLGCLVAGFLRYLMHFISGAILYGSYAEWFFTENFAVEAGAKILNTFTGTALVLIYSAIYNGLYMIPEILLTTVAAAAVLPLLMRERHIKGLL